MRKGFFLYYLCLVGVAMVSCTNKIDKALLEYKTAIEEGSTMVRIGTAILGARDYSK